MLVCVSANHKCSDSSVLDQLAGVNFADLAVAISAYEGIRGFIFLSTCNRSELYMDLKYAAAIENAFIALSIASGLDEDILRANCAVFGNKNVSEHLFSVSSGLESIAIGEEEITGQVKRALALAHDKSVTTSALEKMFQMALLTSKSVRTQTSISTQGKSLVALALELAASSGWDIPSLKILLIGTGKYAGATLKALQERGAGIAGVFSPSGRAHTLDKRYNIVNISEAEFSSSIAKADLIVTCTKTTHKKYVLTHSNFVPDREKQSINADRSLLDLKKKRKNKLIIDLGMPYNVDPDITNIPGIDLLNIETIRLHAPIAELGASEMAQCIIARAAAKFRNAYKEDDARNAISIYRNAVQQRLNKEMAKRTPKEQNSALIHQVANALMHPVTMRVKELTRNGRGDEAAAAIRLIFGE